MKTVLCVPGHDLKKVEGCRRWGADLILFDLEDSVPEDRKDLAREIVAAHITPNDHVRVSTGTDIRHETRYLAGFAKPMKVATNTIWIPKLTRWEDLAKYECREVVIIIETPQLVYKLAQLKGSCPLGPYVLAGLAFGAADFAAYMNVPASSPQVAYARQQVALAATALGVEAYDSPFVNLRPDSYGKLREDAYKALELGYQWKGVVHPAQIPVVRDMKYEALFDEMLIKDYERERGEEVVTIVDGQVVAPPMIRAARKRLEEVGK